MRIGIIGLPNSGKTTIFNVLTGDRVPTTAYTGGTFQVHTAVVAVPDARVDRLSEMYQPKKTTYARVEYADIAGLSGAKADDEPGRGVTLGGELVGAIANNDALLHVVRAFEDENIPHPFETVDPARDIASLDAELGLSDLGKIENRLERLTTSLKKGKALPTFEDDQKEFELLSRLKPHVEAGLPLRDFELTTDEEKRLRGFQFLSIKPVLIILNLGDTTPPPQIDYPHKKSSIIWVRGRLEMDLAQLDEDDRAIFMEEYSLTELSTAQIIRQSYDLLGRMVFFTVGEDEVRAWEVHRGASALECAGAIHSDLARGFIRAEVVSYEDLMTAGSHAAARSAGKVRLEGRDHVIHDGDIIVVRFNVQ
jgi:GTP-binding protein YchF